MMRSRSYNRISCAELCRGGSVAVAAISFVRWRPASRSIPRQLGPLAPQGARISRQGTSSVRHSFNFGRRPFSQTSTPPFRFSNSKIVNNKNTRLASTKLVQCMPGGGHIFGQGLKFDSFTGGDAPVKGMTQTLHMGDIICPPFQIKWKRMTGENHL